MNTARFFSMNTVTVNYQGSGWVTRFIEKSTIKTKKDIETHMGNFDA